MIIVQLPFSVPSILAVGGEVKNTFCLAREQTAWMSQPNGDMDFLETVRRFEASLDDMQACTGVIPEVIACDLHPGYRSTRWAEAAAVGKLPLVKVQHHHAHIAAVMAEHGLSADARVIGIALDGTGYGTDGAIWGGEMLLAGYQAFTRVAHLRYAPLAGGDAAVRKPYRMALAHLWAAGVDWDADLPPTQVCSATELGILRRQLERGINTVPTSSVGRLFDAVAALIDIRQVVDYEAQAAIELERCAAPTEDTPYAFGIDETGETVVIDAAPVLRAIIFDWRAGTPAPQLAAWFHGAVAEAFVSAALLVRQRTKINIVALSGGVFQNALLLNAARQKFAKQGFEVLTHQQVSPNDSGIALGQAAVAGSLNT